MSGSSFPVFAGQAGLRLENFSIDGSEVGASAGTAGLDGRGKMLCTISKSTNRVTVTWLRSYARAYVFFQPAAGQNDTIVQLVTNDGEQLVFDTVKATDGTAVNDADLDVVVFGYSTTSFVN